MTQEQNAMAVVGSRVRFKDKRMTFIVQARDARYLICTRPFAPKKTVLYTVIDLVEKVRGPDNMVLCFGHETRQDCEERLRDFNDATLPYEVSHRRRLPLDVEYVRPPNGGA